MPNSIPKEKKKIIPKRTPMPVEDPSVRRGNFGEVAVGYTPEMAMAEAGRCLRCREPKCIEGCPVNVPIPEFISCITEGRFDDAINTIRQKNLLPAVCGRVCPQERQCEARCLLGKKNEPVAIGRLERFAADHAMKSGSACVIEKYPSTGMKVAIVGSGPAGLTCAYDLAMMGHEVTVYEALHSPGGVLVYGIPEFRLPKDIVAREIDAIKALGVRFIMNAVIGKLITLDELLNEYDACFIGTGAGLPRFLGIEGENLNGVYSANEFLTRVNLMKAYSFPNFDTPVLKPGRVAVIGGGNVAMDAVRTAVRLGASDATIVYRRSLTEMPARREEVEHAGEEGVQFELCTDPVRIIGDGSGRAVELECRRMDLCELDSSGRRVPKPVEGSEFRIPVDTIVIAAGSGANPLLTAESKGLNIDGRGYIIADEETGRTSIEGVYAGGDIVTGSATVISAMGAGRRTAAAIHRYLLAKKAKVSK